MHMNNGIWGIFSFFSLFIAFVPFIIGIYFLLQFLRTNRERNDLLYEILEELRKKNADK